MEGVSCQTNTKLVQTNSCPFYTIIQEVLSPNLMIFVHQLRYTNLT